jgi:hypothetical protein
LVVVVQVAQPLEVVAELVDFYILLGKVLVLVLIRLV